MKLGDDELRQRIASLESELATIAAEHAAGGTSARPLASDAKPS